MEELIWIGDQFGTVEDFKEWEELNQYRILSPSRISSISSCPRKFRHHYLEGIRPKEKAVYLDAGSLLHTGIDTWYFTGTIDEAIDEMRAQGGEHSPRPDDEHFSLPHLEIIVRNYADHWTAHDAYTPLSWKLEDLNLDGVLAARWRMAPDGRVILSESPMLMIVENPHGDDFLIQGIPDLPVENHSGNLFIMDHKTTGGYISQWWSGKYRISDQFRMYMIMLADLLGRPFQGTILDAVYMGKYATSSTSTATKFDRSEYFFDDTMLQETLRNYDTWTRTIQRYNEDGYWPQATGLYCGTCQFMRLCQEPVWARDPLPIELEYSETQRSILD